MLFGANACWWNAFTVVGGELLDDRPLAAGAAGRTGACRRPAAWNSRWARVSGCVSASSMAERSCSCLRSNASVPGTFGCDQALEQQAEAEVGVAASAPSPTPPDDDRARLPPVSSMSAAICWPGVLGRALLEQAAHEGGDAGLVGRLVQPDVGRRARRATTIGSRWFSSSMSSARWAARPVLAAFSREPAAPSCTGSSLAEPRGLPLRAGARRCPPSSAAPTRRSTGLLLGRGTSSRPAARPSAVTLPGSRQVALDVIAGRWS